MMLRETSALFKSSQYDLRMIDGVSGVLATCEGVIHPWFRRDHP